MQAFLWGAASALSLVASLFFLRFWRRQGDRLFLVFALAFGLLSANWALLAVMQPPRESTHHLYLVRLAAYLLIVLGVVDRNRKR